MHIRDERPGNEQDCRIITRIEYTAFKGHPMHAPGAEPTEHLIVERLRASGNLTLSLLAEVDGEPVGHVALSPVVVGADHIGWYLLGPVGVLPPMQGRGIGSALIREALRRMRKAGALGVVLVGDPATTPGLASPACRALAIRACPSCTCWPWASATGCRRGVSPPTRPSRNRHSANNTIRRGRGMRPAPHEGYHHVAIMGF